MLRMEKGIVPVRLFNLVKLKNGDTSRNPMD